MLYITESVILLKGEEWNSLTKFSGIQRVDYIVVGQWLNCISHRVQLGNLSNIQSIGKCESCEGPEDMNILKSTKG